MKETHCLPATGQCVGQGLVRLNSGPKLGFIGGQSGLRVKAWLVDSVHTGRLSRAMKKNRFGKFHTARSSVGIVRKAGSNSSRLNTNEP